MQIESLRSLDIDLQEYITRLEIIMKEVDYIELHAIMFQNFKVGPMCTMLDQKQHWQNVCWNDAEKGR